MNAAIVSLLAVTVGFFALVAYVYRPSRRDVWRARGAIPLHDHLEDHGADVRPGHAGESQGNKR